MGLTLRLRELRNRGQPHRQWSPIGDSFLADAWASWRDVTSSARH